MRSRRTMLALAATAALGASTLVIGPAAAQDPPAKLKIVGGIKMKAGQFIKDNQRFAPRNLAVDSGGEVRLTNQASVPDPHTISVVAKSDLPKTAQQAFECEVCGEFFAAHEVDEESEDVGQPVVDVGEPGFDRPGDSIVVGGDPVRFEVSAAAGTNLYYLCAIHPWMQGKLRVR